MVLAFGKGYQHFAVESPMAALKQDERRYHIPVQDLPEEIQLASPGRSRRCCIMNTTSQSSKLEARWSEARPRLHEFLDMGAVSYQPRYYLYCGLPVRGTWFLDPPHRRHDNALNAWRKSHVSYVKNEVAMAMNMSKAPFGGAAFHWTVKECLAEYVASHTFKDKLFQHLYPYIIFDWTEGQVDAEHFDEEFMEAFFDEMPASASFRNMGSYSKENRWFQTPRRSIPFQRVWSLELLALARLGLIEGWFKTINDFGLFAHSVPTPPRLRELGGPDQAPAEAPEGPGAEAVEAPEAPEAAAQALRRVAVSDQEPKKIARASKRNGLHLKCSILCNRNTKNLMCFMARVMKSTMLEHGVTLEKLVTEQGCQDWYTAQATGDWNESIKKYWGAFSDRDTLVQMGLLHYRKSYLDTAFLERAEGDKIVQATMLYTIDLVASDIQWLRGYSELAPGIFAGLMSPDPEKVAKVLERCQQMYLTVQTLEKEALRDTWVRGFADKLLFPLQIWCREVLCALDEAEFRSAPPDIMQEIHEAFHGGTSLTNENLFNWLRAKQKLSKNSDLGPTALYSLSVSCDLLDELDGVHQLDPLPEDVQEAPSSELPESTWRAKSHKFSMGDNTLEKYMDKTFWPSPSSVAAMWVPDALSAAVLYCADIPSLKKCWLSL